MEISNIFVVYAIEECKKSTYRQRVGAVIFNKKQLISKGYNSSSKSIKKLHPKFQKWHGSVHAEVDAIIKAKKNLKGCDMIIVRVNRKNELKLAKPCSDCMKYMKYVGIRKIFYTINNYPYIKEDRIF